jgi:hypothetical protein
VCGLERLEDNAGQMHDSIPLIRRCARVAVRAAV